MSNAATLLEPRSVGDITGRFIVPSYQRGYRWTELDVTRLLSDIFESGEATYYLQPVVVRSMPGGEWELIDGQQRMTTLFLLYRYIQGGYSDDPPRFTVGYATRPGSEEFLSALPSTADTSARNVDFHFMAEAYNAIAGWFSAGDRPFLKAKLQIDLKLRVKVIWYEVDIDSDEDAIELFRRLNVGRIPLTDAELVKAHLLAKLRQVQPGREHQVAASWDAIERDLRGPEAWAFLTGGSAEQSTRIGLLLENLVSEADLERSYGVFEVLRERINQEPMEFWRAVEALHSRIMGWFSESELYHYIGYLIARPKESPSLREMIAQAEELSQSAFTDKLKEAIRGKLDLSVEELREVQYGTEAQREQALDVLTLMNVLTSHRAGIRYSFKAHAGGSWSLEHIHPQRGQSLRSQAQWVRWIKENLETLEAIPDPVPGLAAIKQDADAVSSWTEGTFRDFEVRIHNAFEEAGQEANGVLDAIDNLALLGGGENSALNNSLFATKRQKIIEMDQQGRFIPICTRNLFLKYYTPTNADHPHFWSASDRHGYLQALEHVLEDFLTTPEEEIDE